MRRALLLFSFLCSLLFGAGCGSSAANRPADVAKPTIQVQQAGSIFFGSGSSAPVSINVQVTNNASVPLRVREVEISSPGMMQYEVVRTTRQFNETIAPGETRTVGLVATAVARDRRVDRAEPLSLRAIIRFEADGKPFREIVMQQIAGEGAN